MMTDHLINPIKKLFTQNNEDSLRRASAGKSLEDAKYKVYRNPNQSVSLGHFMR